MAEERGNPAAAIGLGFGMVWLLIGALGLHAPLKAPSALGIVLAAAVLGAVARRAPRRDAPRLHKDRALIAWSIGCEMAVIAAGVALAAVNARPDLILPLVALAVGVHFLPLAKAFHEPALFAVGLAIALVGLASLVLPGSVRPVVIGFGAGVSLWSAILYDAASKA